MFENSNRMARAMVLLSLLAGAVFAQQFRGTVSGLVLDPLGAIIAGAKVAATQLETGAKSHTLTGPTGRFNLPFLAPGTYTISVSWQDTTLGCHGSAVLMVDIRPPFVMLGPPGPFCSKRMVSMLARAA